MIMKKKKENCAAARIIYAMSWDYRVVLCAHPRVPPPRTTRYGNSTCLDSSSNVSQCVARARGDRVVYRSVRSCRTTFLTLSFLRKHDMCRKVFLSSTFVSPSGNA